MNLVVALQAEAVPLVEHFGLAADNPQGIFPIYRGDDELLVVSGVGRVLCAAAVAHLHGSNNRHPGQAWLNVGIAGHQQVAIGEAVLASRITEQTSGRSWFPPYVLDTQLARSMLVTVDEPEQRYDECCAYDMEASGFYRIASRCSSGELIQSLKIISDNPGTLLGFNSDRISQLIADQMPAIKTVLDELRALSDSLESMRAITPSLQSYIERWHFTVSQRHRLNALLTRWNALSDQDPWALKIGVCKDAARVLTWLETQLMVMPINLSDTGNSSRVPFEIGRGP